MTNLFAAVFWLIAALINTGGDDALSSLPRDIPGRSGVYGVPSVVRVADEQDALGDHEHPPSLSVAGGIPEQGVPDLDVLPALRTATASSSTYSIPVHGLAYDGAVVPSVPMPIPTPTLVETMEAEAPKEVVCEWECILRSVGWPEYAIPAALSVSWCESRWRDVQNFSGGNFWGRFQISPYWHADKLLARGYPATGQALLNPWVNAEIALMIWSGSGWSQWECKP